MLAHKSTRLSASIDVFVHSRRDSAPPLHLNRVFYLDARNLVNGHIIDSSGDKAAAVISFPRRTSAFGCSCGPLLFEFA